MLYQLSYLPNIQRTPKGPLALPMPVMRRGR